MGFYKQLSFIALIFLIIALSVIGTILVNSKDSTTFPPHIGECPDFYKKNDSGNCEAMKEYYDGSVADLTSPGLSENSSDILPGTTCSELNFDYAQSDADNIFKVQGTGPESGACKKKQLAKECKITWDGITNNADICY
jgi:hypothetical protein